MNRRDVLRAGWWRTAALRRPWVAALVVGVAAGWGVAHSQPCSVKWRGGGCAVELPYDSTWTGGLVWGPVAAVAVRVVLALLARRDDARRRG